MNLPVREWSTNEIIYSKFRYSGIQIHYSISISIFMLTLCEYLEYVYINGTRFVYIAR